MHLTAIVATHNSARTVVRALSQIYGHPNIAECIVVDNASTDGTAEFIKSQFPKVRLIQNAVDMKLGAALNQALLGAHTEFALLINPASAADDASISTMLEHFMDAPKLAMVVSGLHDNDPLIGKLALWRIPYMKKTGFCDPAFFLSPQQDDIVNRTRQAGYEVMLLDEAGNANCLAADKPSSEQSQRPEPIVDYWHALQASLQMRHDQELADAKIALEERMRELQQEEIAALTEHKLRVEEAMEAFRGIPETEPLAQARMESLLKAYETEWQACIVQHEKHVADAMRRHHMCVEGISEHYNGLHDMVTRRWETYMHAFTRAGRMLTTSIHYALCADPDAVRIRKDSVTIAVITYKRADSLLRALQALSEIMLPPDTQVNVLVVDNDAEKSAWPLVQECALKAPFSVDYVVEEQRGIPHARNKALCEARERDYIAFVDDDDVVAREWLYELLKAARTYHADVVKGQVICTFEPKYQRLCRLSFFAPFRIPTGCILESAWTNNVLFSTRIYKYNGLFFDPAFTQTGGSDNHFFRCAQHEGAHIIFASDAIVYSPVQPPRTSWWWIARRYIRNGATGTISYIKLNGYGYALRQVGNALAALPNQQYRIMRRMIGGGEPLCSPLMAACFVLGRGMGLLRLSPREYK